MQFTLVHSLHQVGVNPEFASISIGAAIPRWLGKMSWKPVEVCALFAPSKKNTFLTSAHPQLSVNMQFALLHSL